MNDYLQKVLWDEGMVLAPQHFQQTERYFEDLINRRVRAAHPMDWGLLSLRVDREALAGGEFLLQEGAAVFPDGVQVAFPSADSPPAPRKIEVAFPANAPSLGVYLAMPRVRPGERAYRTDPESEMLTPYDGAAATLRDEVGEAAEREVKVGKKRLRLLFTSEQSEAYSCLPVAVLRRTASGGFELDDGFIPTCQYASASPRLMASVRRVLEVMVQKSEDLSKQRRHRSDGSGMVDLTAAESIGFWFLYTINSHLPVIRSLFQHSRVHPFEIYRELSTLAGALTTFSAEGGPGDIPPYSPDDLSGTFLPLEAQILKLLGTTMPSRCVPIPLERTRELVHTGRIHDERLLSTARFFLSVAAEVPPEKVIAELPIKGKISSADQVDGLIVRALPGLQIAHIEAPPPEVPAQPGRVYFQLAQMGDHWEAIRASGSLAIFVPAEFGSPKLELVAVKV